jgi:hypothetical protein
LAKLSVLRADGGERRPRLSRRRIEPLGELVFAAQQI